MKRKSHKKINKSDNGVIMHIDKIYYGGTICTVDPQNSMPEALAVSQGRIAAIGSQKDIFKLKNRNTKCIDLCGATLLPGFIDGHSHFLRAGLYEETYLDLRPKPIGSIECVDDILRKLKEKVSCTPAGTWIACHGYDDTALKEKRHITKAELDAVSTQHPIYLRHVSGHLAVVNSCAFSLAHITDSVSNPEGGIFGRTSSGELNGLMEEPAAINQVICHMPDPTEEQWQKGLDTAVAMYTQKGITTAQDGSVTPIIWQQIFKGYERNALHCKVQLFPLDNQPLEHIPALPSGTKLTKDGKISLGAIKLLSDGSIQGYTGYLSQPYHTNPIYCKNKEWYGYPAVRYEKLKKDIIKFHLQGRQVAVHGNGDAAIDDIINAVEEAQKTDGNISLRHIIVHCQMAREDQLEKMKKLNILPSFFPAHIYYWGDRHRDIFLGQERAQRLNPLASALAHNLTFSLHNDSPITPIDPLLLLWTAVNRKTSGGKLLGEQQKISVAEGIKALTIHAAYQVHEEKEKGSIEIGKAADFTLLEQNPYAVDPDQIKDIRIIDTAVNGNGIKGCL